MSEYKKKKIGTDTRLHRAGEWWMELHGGEVSAERLAAWLEWTRADARNLDAFERVRDLARGLGALDEKSKRDLLRASLPERRPPASKFRARRWVSPARLGYAMAAGIVVAAAALSFYFFPRGQAPAAPFSATYASATAQNRSLSLPDGSHIELGAASRIRVAYTRDTRTVALVSGEAYFKVQHNAKRPFFVHAGPLQIEDIGTAFDVRRGKSRTVVAVAHGMVNVSYAPVGGTVADSYAPVSLAAGQQLVADAAQPQLITSRINTVAVASWREGLLHFKNTSLAAVIANVNRYAKHPIVIAEPAVGRLRYTGTVSVKHIDKWLAAVRDIFPLREDRNADGRILLYMQNSS